jgi:hypothetical protein
MLDHAGGLEASRGGCLCLVSDGGQCGPRSCAAPVSVAGTVFFPYDSSTWLAFACDGHSYVLTDPHPLTDAEQAELAARRHNHELAVNGKKYARPHPLRRGKWRG